MNGRTFPKSPVLVVLSKVSPWLYNLDQQTTPNVQEKYFWDDLFGAFAHGVCVCTCWGCSKTERQAFNTTLRVTTSDPEAVVGVRL